LFARCITGYKYSEKSEVAAVKNCFISVLNSKVIDVDKLDYLIRDAYTTGFNTVNIDYIRLLQALTISGKNSDIQIAYYKDAVSVIENVVYAHDAERKWIQNHPVVLYECYILNHVFQQLSDYLDKKKHKLFSYESLTVEGHQLKNKVKVSLLCDDDIIYFLKNYISSDISREFFHRSNRRHPIWKSEAEYEALFSGAMGGRNDSMEAFEHAMNAAASYLSGTSDTWVINDETIEKLENELTLLDEKDLENQIFPKRLLFLKAMQRRLSNVILELWPSRCKQAAQIARSFIISFIGVKRLRMILIRQSYVNILPVNSRP
jgi:hypothetical protein